MFEKYPTLLSERVAVLELHNKMMNVARRCTRCEMRPILAILSDPARPGGRLYKLRCRRTHEPDTVMVVVATELFEAINSWNQQQVAIDFESAWS